MKNLSQEITDALIMHEYISAEKRDSYIYCYTYLIENMKYDLIMLITGIILHKFGITFIFILLFNIFRSICGGYHAKTPTACNVMSYLTSALFFVLSITADVIPRICLIIIFVISSFIIITFSPLDCETKKFTSAQKSILKNHIAITQLVSSIAFLFFIVQNKILYCYTITFCVMVISVSLIAQKINNIKGCHYDI